jgi:hypothetical protein
MRAAILCLLVAILCFILLIEVNSCTAQTSVRGFAWEYDFSQYEDNSIYFILYQKVDTDTSFNVWDTTAVNALHYDVIGFGPLYNFTWREWCVTAIQHKDSWDPDMWSFESARSDTLRVYFRALPPAPIGGGEIHAEYIDVGKIPEL